MDLSIVMLVYQRVRPFEGDFPIVSPNFNHHSRLRETEASHGTWRFARGTGACAEAARGLGFIANPEDPTMKTEFLNYSNYTIPINIL